MRANVLQLCDRKRARHCYSSRFPTLHVMYPRKPVSHAEQIARMGRCLQRLRTQLRHRYDEYFEATKGRRECALEVQLRHRLLEATRDIVDLAEACLEEVRRQEVLFYAAFKPGDCVVVDHENNAVVSTRSPYLVVDVCPDKGRDFHYRAVELTKKGTIHKRRTAVCAHFLHDAAQRHADLRGYRAGGRVLPRVCPDLANARL